MDVNALSTRYCDYGLDHVDFNKGESANITRSDIEVKYVKTFKSTCPNRDVFRRCLESIVANPNAEVRRAFHMKHLRSSSVLRDGVKNK